MPHETPVCTSTQFARFRSYRYTYVVHQLCEVYDINLQQFSALPNLKDDYKSAGMGIAAINETHIFLTSGKTKRFEYGTKTFIYDVNAQVYNEMDPFPREGKTGYLHTSDIH